MKALKKLYIKMAVTVLVAVILFAFFCLKGVAWLAVLFLIIGSIFYLLLYYNRRLIAFLSLIVMLGVTARLFVFELYNVPSESMENSIIPGDLIFVSKLNYGPTIPVSFNEISLSNVFSAQKAKLPVSSLRFTGFGKVERNDVVVFRRNADTYFVKRCLGLPGEKFAIKKRDIFINNHFIKPIPDIKFLYKIDVNKFTTIAEHLHIAYNLSHIDRNLQFAETELSIRDINKIESIDKTRGISPITTDTVNTYMSQFFHWSIDNFGEIIIPAKNMRIKLTDTSYTLYKDVFNQYEKNPVYRSAGKFYSFNGQEIKYYTFKYNYYFMLGDNRSNSDDSRFWGFLPETLIEGKALFVLYSINNGSMNYSRTFRAL